MKRFSVILWATPPVGASRAFTMYGKKYKSAHISQEWERKEVREIEYRKIGEKAIIEEFR